MKAQAATLREIAHSKLRRLLARNKTFNCAERDVGDMALFYKAQNRKSSPRRRGPAEVLEIDEAGATVSFQRQNSKVARYCGSKRTKDSEVTGRDERFLSTPGGPWMGPLDGDTWLTPALQENVPSDQKMGDGEVPTESGGKSTDVTEDPSMASPHLIPVPGSPTHSGDPALPPIWGFQQYLCPL